MLLDQIFGRPDKLEIFIEIQDGNLKHKTRKVPITVDHEQSEKPLFPINNTINKYF
jgi:hypothetical protein